MTQTYQELKAIADDMRANRHDEPPLWAKRPHVVASAPSRHAPEKIPVHIYTSNDADPAHSSSKPKPVHVNWHGSGFVYENLGQNAEWCHRTAHSLDMIIVDAQYSKAPEHPYPRALEDCVDVIQWIQSQPWFSPKIGMSIGGWSAGANLTLAMAAPLTNSCFGLTAEQAAHIKTALSVYPCTDSDPATVDHKLRDGKDVLPADSVGITFSATTLRTFFSAYFLGAPADVVNRPETSPLRVSDQQLDSWLQTPLLLITCEHDPLEEEGRLFAQRLIKRSKQTGKGDVELLELPGVSHRWEIDTGYNEEEWDTKPGGKQKRHAFDKMEQRLRKTFSL